MGDFRIGAVGLRLGSTYKTGAWTSVVGPELVLNTPLPMQLRIHAGVVTESLGEKTSSTWTESQLLGTGGQVKVQLERRLTMGGLFLAGGIGIGARASSVVKQETSKRPSSEGQVPATSTAIGGSYGVDGTVHLIAGLSGNGGFGGVMVDVNKPIAQASTGLVPKASSALSVGAWLLAGLTF